MDASDCYEHGTESDCCGANVYLGDICSDCKDHCTPVDLEEEQSLMDEYRDKGMSPSDFHSE